MFDARCYHCVETVTNPEDPEFYENKFVETEYQRKGIFKCPRCNNVTDLSESVFTTKISRLYDEEGELYTEILEFDPKLNDKNDGKSCFGDDILESDLLDDLPFGKYELDVLWYYYECGGMYGEEWDMKLEILSEEEIENINKYT